jgi:hypothetical protein
MPKRAAAAPGSCASARGCSGATSEPVSDDPIPGNRDDLTPVTLGIPNAACVRWVDEKPPSAFSYVRRVELPTRRRRGRPRWYGPGRLVAYADLPDRAERDMPGGLFIRPVWWVRDADPYAPGYWPCEGDDPTVLSPAPVTAAA